jgi:hypothetical protein
MALGLPTPVERLGASHATFKAIKASPEAAVARLAVQINTLAPPRVLGTTAQQLFSRHTLVFSNVPGPAHPVYVGGCRVLAIQPVFPNLIPQVLCISYDGQLYMSIAVDPTAVPDPGRLGRLYLDELETLKALHGIGHAQPEPPISPPISPPRPARANGGSAAHLPGPSMSHAAAPALAPPARRAVPPPPPRSPAKVEPPHGDDARAGELL